jgi:hypothetical protein
MIHVDINTYDMRYETREVMGHFTRGKERGREGETFSSLGKRERERGRDFLFFGLF